MISLRELIQAGHPDRNGNVLSPTVQQGSAVVSSPEGTAADMTAVISAGFFSPVEATCGDPCNYCSGVVGVEVTPNPAATPVSSTVQMTSTATYSNGTTSNVTNGSSWTSSSVSIATVSSSGTSGRGVVTGVAAGTSTVLTPGTFSDHLSGESLSNSPVPVPVCIGDSTPVDHWGQDWLIGATTIGLGKRVQSDTIQAYVNHAEHRNIVSPSP